MGTNSISDAISGTIIVTGANGFIGSAIVWALNQIGKSHIICVDTVAASERPELLKRRQYTQFLLKNELWDYLNSPKAQEVSWVIHMGANSSTTETNWDHLYENNTLYTQRIFQWCAENQKNLIYASSAATYGAGELGYDDEVDSEQLKALNLYGQSKLIFDQWAKRQSSVPPHWYGLRFFNVYGPNEYHKGTMSSVVYKAFHQIRDSQELQLFKSYRPEFADGEQKRDFIYIKEVTLWILELMKKTPDSGIYNMGAGQARSWLDLGRNVFSSMHAPEKIRFVEMPANIKNQYQYFTEATMSHWKRAGLSDSQWNLECGIKDYVQNYLLKDDPYL